MYFDWITWSIWMIGFAILVIWTWIPIKEFKKLLKERKAELLQGSDLQEQSQKTNAGEVN